MVSGAGGEIGRKARLDVFGDLLRGAILGVAEGAGEFERQRKFTGGYNCGYSRQKRIAYHRIYDPGDGQFDGE